MEAGMERWGVPVPHGDDEEKTELALSFDDAEFQHDPVDEVRPVDGGPDADTDPGRCGPPRRRAAPRRESHPMSPVPGTPPARPGITVPFDGIPLHAHREWFARLRELGIHRPVVGRGRRRRRVHAPRPGRRLGAAR